MLGQQHVIGLKGLELGGSMLGACGADHTEAQTQWDHTGRCWDTAVGGKVSSSDPKLFELEPQDVTWFGKKVFADVIS